MEFGDWRPAWPRAAGAMRTGILRAMNSRGGSIGQPWPKGRPKYIERKLRQGFGNVQLVRTGRLRSRAVTAEPSMRKRSVSVGFTGKRWAHAPKLQFKDGYWFVAWDEQAKKEVKAAVDDYVQTVFARVRQKIGVAR